MSTVQYVQGCCSTRMIPVSQAALPTVSWPYKTLTGKGGIECTRLPLSRAARVAARVTAACWKVASPTSLDQPTHETRLHSYFVFHFIPTVPRLTTTAIFHRTTYSRSGALQSVRAQILREATERVTPSIDTDLSGSLSQLNNTPALIHNGCLGSWIVPVGL